MLLNLLLIEDSADDAELLLRTIKKSKYSIDYQRICTAEDLQDALRSKTWDIVITDHVMPLFTSQEAIAMVKNFSRDLPIIVVSGAIGEEQAVAAMRCGAHDYLLKDNLKRLVPVIKREIKESKIRKLQSKRLKTLEIAIDQSRNIMFVTDKFGKIEHVNRRFVDVTGYSLEDAIGQTANIFRSKGEEDHMWDKQLHNTVITKKDWVGVMLCRDKSSELFWALVSISPVFESGEVVSLVNVAEDFSKYKEKEIALTQKAFHDPLTNLPNRLLFDEQLERAFKLVDRNNNYAALLSLDLDKFKEVNDTLGHIEGDNLLIEMAKRLRRCVREADTIARMGGDEFCVLLTDLENENDVKRIVDKILEVLAVPIQLTDVSKLIHVSIGIAIVPTDGKSSLEIKKHSDYAMYQAKYLGQVQAGSHYVYYDKILDKNLSAKRERICGSKSSM